MTHNKWPLIPVLTLLCGSLLYGCANNTDDSDTPSTPAAPAIPMINFSVMDYSPHDTSSYTEGFLVHEGQLYESTGHVPEFPYTRSLFGVVDRQTGKIAVKVENENYFGEGIVFFSKKVYQLTYKTHLGFIYDAKTFKQLETFPFANAEGWGLTTDGTHLIMSDGTAELTYADPVGFRPIKKLKVTENGIPRDSLNELEYIKGFIYANIWYNDHIVKIDPADGKVVGKLDLSSLGFQERLKHADADVLNGIAYDSVADKIYVTGKLWPNIYQINFPH